MDATVLVGCEGTLVVDAKLKKSSISSLAFSRMGVYPVLFPTAGSGIGVGDDNSGCGDGTLDSIKGFPSKLIIKFMSSLTVINSFSAAFLSVKCANAINGKVGTPDSLIFSAMVVKRCSKVF